MSEVITIHNKNEVYFHVKCSQGVAYELREHFSFRAPNFQFHPLVKQRLWDGYIRLFNSQARELYRGLYDDLVKFCADKGYTLEYPDEVFDTEFAITDAQTFIHKLKPAIQPDEYQLNSFVHSIRSRRRLVLSPTGSGKSLLIYLITLYLLTREKKKGLVIVPRSQLVEQLYSNYEEYSTENGFKAEKYCHRIYQGKDKVTEKPITISTWQSLMRMPAPFFEQFDYVICDEVHGAQSKEISKIVSFCTKASYRVGLTGTLSGAKTHEIVLKGLFGSIYKAVSSKELMDKNRLAQLEIKCLLLNYKDEERKAISKVDYKQEIDYIVGHAQRNKFITNLALSLNGNTLVLFNYVEHGKALYEAIKANTRRNVYLIHGKTEVEDREEIRKIVEQDDCAIIVGSSGVLSTGTNIVNLHNAIFASPSKSRIRNLQSVGRILRKGDSKSSATLYDIADSFQWKTKQNYTLRHFSQRLEYYAEEQFKFRVYKIELKGK